MQKQLSVDAFYEKEGKLLRFQFKIGKTLHLVPCNLCMFILPNLNETHNE
jgi:hypothetical protein